MITADQLKVDDAERFLNTLDPHGAFTFQTLPDQKSAKRSGKLLSVHHGTLQEHLDSLVKLNQEGAGIFVMVNEGNGKILDDESTCRTTRNVIRVRAAFVDLDGAPIAPVLKSERKPMLIVETSPGRWHAYWRINNCPLDQFKTMQLALAKKFDGDPSVNDLCRIMRIPGFMHQKKEPFRSRIVDIDELIGAKG